MGLLTNIIIQTAVYLAVFIITFLIFNFLSKGYLKSYLIVKASRGGKILVRILSYTGYYYKDGKIDSGLLSFKNRSKNIDSYRLRKTDIYEEMGVNSITIDETTKKIIHAFNDPREGHDTEHTDNLIKRALYKPSMKDNPKELIIMFASIVSAVASVIILYLVYTLSQNAGAVGVV